MSLFVILVIVEMAIGSALVDPKVLNQHSFCALKMGSTLFDDV